MATSEPEHKAKKMSTLSNLAGLLQITQYGISLCMPVKLDKRYNKSKAKIYA